VRAFHVPEWAERHNRQKDDSHHVIIAWSDEWLVVPAGRWRREGDKIGVAYRDHDELFWSVEYSRLLKEALGEPKTVEQASLFEGNGNYGTG
jgi:hypothetical protein